MPEMRRLTWLATADIFGRVCGMVLRQPGAAAGNSPVATWFGLHPKLPRWKPFKTTDLHGFI
jgi:hypothetical protein